MNGLPSASANFLVTMRATASTDPPAGCGTMTRTDLVGQASAAKAAVAANEPHTANATAIRTLASNGHFRSIRISSRAASNGK
jgi:hypothetical protein